MILKQREKSKLQLGLLALEKRIELQDTDRNYLLNLEKGFEGEECFDEHVKTYLNKEVIVLNDLLLSSRNNTFQVDSLLITSETIHIYEIKNYKGSYQMSSGQLMTLTGQEINSPLNQLNRSKTLMKQLIKDLGYSFTVEASVIFVHPTFVLFQAKASDPFIYPNQIEKHFKEMNQRLAPLSKEQHYFAQKLIKENRESVPYQKQLPEFKYSKLQKNIYCKTCGGKEVTVTRKKSYCSRCRSKLPLEETILYHIEEFKLLFPDEKMTVHLLYEWCGKKVSPRRLRTVCNKHYTKVGTTSNSYYK